MKSNEKYLRLLSKHYPTIGATTSEIINLEAILNLPKATEHFVSDIHGEYEAFQHVLRGQRDRAPADQAKPSVDQRPPPCQRLRAIACRATGRANEPNYQGGNRRTFPLRQP